VAELVRVLDREGQVRVVRVGDRRTVPALDGSRLDAIAGLLRRGVDVGEEPERLGADTVGGGERGVDVSGVAEVDGREPNISALFGEQLQQTPLLGGRGVRVGRLVRGGMDSDVADETLSGVLSQEISDFITDHGAFRSTSGWVARSTSLSASPGSCK